MTADQEEPAPKRRGRPPTGKRGSFSFRVTDALRVQLEQEARTHQRPVSEIIELRLEQSLGRSRLDQHTEQLANLVGLSISMSQLIAGKSWREDSDLARYAYTRVVFMLAKLMGVTPHSELSSNEKEHAIAIEEKALAEEKELVESRSQWGEGGLIGRLRGTDPLESSK